jgi:hypothetical protein
LLVLKIVVLIYFCNCCWVVKMLGLFDKSVEASIMTGKEGKKLWSHCFRGGVSIVRVEESFVI